MTATLIALVIALIYAGYRFDWGGFSGYNKVSITTEVTSSPQKITRTEEYQPGRNLWDWIQLLVVPIILAVGVFWLNQIQKSREEKASKQRAEFENMEIEQRARTEREIASDNQCEATLQSYIDKMSELLLGEGLRESDSKAEVRTIARVRTLTILPRLDTSRKRSVLQFLYDPRLLEKGKTVIDLSEADFTKADLTGANLSNADLKKTNFSGTNLSNADLSNAVLCEANLGGAHLEKANLTEVDLSGTNLSNAHLDEAVLIGANLNNAKLFDAIFTKAYLTGATLQEAYLTGATLQKANLSGANLSNAHLGPVLQEANLRSVVQVLSKYSTGGNFMGVPLSVISALAPAAASILGYVSSKKTDLSNADLSNAILYDTDLHGVNLKAANLHGAIVTHEQLEKAYSLEGTTMPDGSKYV